MNFDTVSKCIEYKNKIEHTIDKAYIGLDCLPKKMDSKIQRWRSK